MPQILGLNIDDYVRKAIEDRQEKLESLSKNSTFNKIFNARTAWATLVSSVDIAEEKAKEISKYTGLPVENVIGTNLAKNLILNKGVSQVSQENNFLSTNLGGYGYDSKAYGFLGKNDDANFGYKPMPGITSVSISYKNNGTLKQAQVKLVAYTLPQFQAIEALYLRLGYTVLLEWGFSAVYGADNDGNFNSYGNFYSNKIYNFLNGTFNSNFRSLLKEIIAERASSGCEYDGMYAKVCNYSWVLNSDLSYDITLDLISMGDIIDSLKFNAKGIYPPLINNSSNNPEAETLSGLENIFLNRSNSLFNSFLYDLRLEVLGQDILKLIEKSNEQSEDVVDKIEEQNETEKNRDLINNNLKLIFDFIVANIENDPNIQRILEEESKKEDDFSKRQVESWENLITNLKNPANYDFDKVKNESLNNQESVIKFILRKNITDLSDFEDTFLGLIDTEFQDKLENELERILGSGGPDATLL